MNVYLEILNKHANLIFTFEKNAQRRFEKFLSKKMDMNYILAYDATKKQYVFADEDYCVWCEYDGIRYSDGDAVIVYIGNDKTTTMHSSMVETYAFECDHDGEYYHWDHYRTFHIEDTDEYVCNVNIHHYYQWEDGCYRSYEEEWDDEYDDYSSEIPGYHSSSRPVWWNDAKGMGIELEVYSQNRLSFYESLPHGIFGEEDGSLSEDYGIELIGGPYNLHSYLTDQTPWSQLWEKLFKTYNVLGGNAPDGTYGMHISVSRSYFRDLHLTKFVMFFNEQDELCKLVAGRSKLYGSYTNGGYKNYKSVGELVSAKNKQVNFKMKSRHEPAVVEDRRVEIRIFRSTVKKEGILKNLEFVDAVREFTKNASVKLVASPQGTNLFIHWLNNQPGYINLKRFFNHKAENKTSIENCPGIVNIKPVKERKPITA